jgi:hypothetical protein
VIALLGLSVMTVLPVLVSVSPASAAASNDVLKPRKSSRKFVDVMPERVTLPEFGVKTRVSGSGAKVTL